MVSPAAPSALPSARYHRVRAITEALCVPLLVEDYGVQAMPEVSPPKWHLAHTTWFFEQFLLLPWLPGYRAFDAHYTYLFNSYYEGVGGFFPRAQRGWLSRPSVAEIYRYRKHVDEAMVQLMGGADDRPELAQRVELGLHHEQQHQELLLTDIKYNLSVNPLCPVYLETPPVSADRVPLEWVSYPGGSREIGFSGSGFAFDNERPRHRVVVRDFSLASRLVSNREFLDFVDDGGYRRPELWLSDGWAAVRQHGWEAPLYWDRADGNWWLFSLSGRQPLNKDEPACHVSFYEADAYARWRGKRLPEEAEWEVAAAEAEPIGHFLETGRLHPQAAGARGGLQQLFGDAWEWTQSPYRPYPGFKPFAGSLGEYNGKFMCNQFVLRGGSCVTAQSHIRATYRNFFYPQDRWQFTGIRLADDAE